jgi:hypothetical protein
VKNAFLAALVAALLSTLAVSAMAEDQVVSVTFASVAALQTKSGEHLDPKLFSFGKSAGNEDRARVQTNGFHKSKAEACRWALLGGFIKFQHKAKENGQRVVGVRTVAGDVESARADRCLCLAGGIMVRSVIKGTYK